MRPAFSSAREALEFAFLLLVLLTGPLWMVKGLLPPRRQSYLTQGSRWGPYPWVCHEIFEETNDIDIAFIGSSHMLWGIDTPYVQQKADEQLGRKTVVRTIAWGGSDFDALYFMAKDLLAHRKVKMLVFYDEVQALGRNAVVPVWFRLADDSAALSDLPLLQKIPFYCAAVVGVPRNLVCLLRPNIPPDLGRIDDYQVRNHAANPATRLGSISSQTGFQIQSGESLHFFPYTPENGPPPSDTCVYSPTTRTNFEFLNLPRPVWQMSFAQKFAALAQQHGCKLVLLHIPTLADSQKAAIQESEFWPDVLHAGIAMVGVPPKKFFAGLSEDDRKKLFSDPYHFNQNGQRYFTPLITPALLKIYESHPKL